MSDFFQNVGVPLIGAATSLFAGIRASKQQQKIVAQQIQAQKEENDANRRYNFMLAQKQNHWNLEQWQRNNDYNTPSAVMSRLREAGVNPHMYYSKGNAMGGVSTASPEMTAGAPSSPIDTSGLLQQRTYGDAVQKAMEQALLSASVRKTNAEAGLVDQKRDTEEYNTDIFKSDAAFRNALNSSSLRLTGMDIELKGSQRNLTDGQVGMLRYEAALLQKQMDKIDMENKQMEANIALMNEQQKYTALKQVLESEQVQAMCKQLASQTALNYRQAQDIAATQAARLLCLKASAEKTQNEAYSVAWDTKIKHLQLDMDSDMFEWRKTMEQAHDVVDLSATVSQEVNRSIQTWKGMQPQAFDETISDVTEKGKGYSARTIHRRSKRK